MVKSKTNGNGKVKAHALNLTRPVVNGEPARRFYYMDELAKAGSKGAEAKTCHARAATRWAKASGESEERYAELIPSTPSNVEFFLKTLRRQNKKAGVKVSTTFKDGVVRVTA